MGDRVTIALTVNGVAREAPVPTDETLLETLRARLGLTGAKRGCDQGVCGACTVMVDGRAVRACLSLSVNCTGLEIVTAEGLARDGVLDPVQRALVESGAIQCGFCTPGLAIAARALLNENPAPTADEIRVAVSGNICRCSGYVKIVEAIEMAARG
ncbi:MAG: (2Fe-2S)-binding protein [Defluviicoccus sp.]|nr:(2Fe-2S)-binding protein [Defluviicoccus sp.]MDE0387022.1 (2Fe-2S)-binding protein [Defluviicoccus sp.]